MKRTFALAAATTLVAVGAQSAGATSPILGSDACSVKGSLTYAKSDRWRVYREFRKKAGRFDIADRIYACRRSSGKLTRLRSLERDTVQKILRATINGDFFAFTEPFEDGGTVGLKTVNLSSGGVSDVIAGPTDIVVTRKGCTAWIDDAANEADQAFRVFKLPYEKDGASDGPDQSAALATSPGIGAHSLGLSGTTASWRQDGKKQTADLSKC